MDKLLYTIGYSGFQIDDFVKRIQEYAINCIIDVRSSPYSSRFVDYNKESLEKLLKNNRIWYMNFSDEFGARQTNKKYYSKEYNCLDFKKFTSESEKFKKGYDRIVDGIAKGYRISLLCAEVDPINCHRAIMIARYFSLHGFSIIHIMPKCTKTQEDIDEELLKSKFPKDTTLSDPGFLEMMGYNYKDMRKEKLEKAYEMKSREIAYRRIDDEECN